jgi:DNA-binding LytR/AlgR family response regulator
MRTNIDAPHSVTSRRRERRKFFVYGAGMEPSSPKAPFPLSNLSYAMLMLCLAGTFMTGVGAFGTWTAPLAVRLSYWLTLMLSCGGLLLAVRLYLATRMTARLAGFRLDLAAALLTAPLFTLIVMGASRVAFASRFGGGGFVRLLGSVLIVNAALLVLRRCVARDAAAPRTGQEVAATPESHFRRRLPFRLRSAAILAVEADDHYLRVHTDAGEAHLHMRLGDAVAELVAFDGLRVHRSWWVARQAIASERWHRGRGTLRLTDGRSVPVSRSYAREIRRFP